MKRKSPAIRSASSKLTLVSVAFSRLGILTLVRVEVLLITQTPSFRFLLWWINNISKDLFTTLNRPAPGLDIKEIIAGLIKLRHEYRGRIWLEILFCRGLNDSPQEINRLVEAVAAIKPDKIQLNTVVRPGALAEAVAVEQAFLKKILPQFGPRAEIIAPFAKDSDYGSTIGKAEKTILATLKRRPCTKSDLEQALGLKAVEVIKILDLMLEKGKIKTLEHSGERYFQTID